MSYTPNLKMTDDRLTRVAAMQSRILETARTAAETAKANDGQLHVKVSSPVFWAEDYMPSGLTPQTLELAEIHRLDHSAAAVRAHGQLAYERMMDEEGLRKVNTVISAGTGSEVVSTTYRQFQTHNPQKPDEKITIHGHTNVAMRMVGIAGTSDMTKSRAGIVAMFTEAAEKAGK